MEPTEGDRAVWVAIGNLSDRPGWWQLASNAPPLAGLLLLALLKESVELAIGGLQPARGFAGQQQNLGSFAIAPGPADFLDIFRGEQGEMPMDNPAHIGAIDPHAKGTGANQGRQCATRPVPFEAAAIARWQARMVGRNGVAAINQSSGQVFANLATAGINQARLPPMRSQPSQQSPPPLGRHPTPLDLQPQIGSVGRSLNDHWILQPQHCRDRGAIGGGCRGRKRGNR
jgi:DNA segregation ATPase FtsK/SpoIIIE-like protein